MSIESEPVFFLGKAASPDDPRLTGPLGSDIGIDEAGLLFDLQVKYRGKFDEVLRHLAEEGILDLSQQPTTLLCDDQLLLKEISETEPSKLHPGRRVRQITEEEIWDSNFLKKRRKRAESRRIERTVDNNKLT